MNCIRLSIVMEGRKADMSMPIRVAIVDDHPGVRAGIKNLLAAETDIQVVGEGANGIEAIRLAEQEKPDILLLDVEIPIMRGDEVTEQLHKRLPEVKVLAVSSYDDPMYIQGMLESGAVGYITKEEVPGLLLEALHSILQDKVKWISPHSASKISRITLEDNNYSGQELDILRTMVLGKPINEIMQTLNIDEATLNDAIQKLMAKFNVTSKIELVRAARCLLSTNSA